MSELVLLSFLFATGILSVCCSLWLLWRVCERALQRERERKL